MGTIRVRFILVALAVSFFAVGMAAFLNYFKYKSTISNIVKSRVLVVGRNIENSVQASLAIGMQFAELQQLPQLMQREKSSDRLVRGIDVFDTSGQVIYSTDRGRVGQKVPTPWIGSAERSKTTEWSSDESDEYVAGISLKNAFDLTVGYLALRYSRDEVERAASTAGREILLAALASFIGIAIVAPLALIVVIRRFERDLRTLEAAATHLEDRGAQPVTTGSAFDTAIGHLRASLREANKALDDLRAKLDSAA
jgi:TRAP-type C4-dicarboxylate transport system permease small subunit